MRAQFQISASRVAFGTHKPAPRFRRRIPQSSSDKQILPTNRRHAQVSAPYSTQSGRSPRGSQQRYCSFCQRPYSNHAEYNRLFQCHQDKVEQQFVEKTANTFLWVSLIIKGLTKRTDASQDSFDKTLASIPTRLDDVYQQILDRSTEREAVRWLYWLFWLDRRGDLL